MRLMQMMLSSLLMVFTGCAEKIVDQTAYLPVQCKVKIVDEPQITECKVDERLNMSDLKDVKKAWAEDSTCTRENWLNEREARLKQKAEAKVCE